MHCGIKRIHNSGFFPFWGGGKKAFDKGKDILAHYVDSDTRKKFDQQF